MSVFRRFTLATVLLLVSGPLQADVILPTGLAPGSQYQLVFVTSGARDATSTNIADYNEFVTNQALLSTGLPVGVTWTAIGSTATVTAANNAPNPAGVPVYNAHGMLVADGTRSLYALRPLLSLPDYDQFGQALNGSAVCWTGASYCLGNNNPPTGLDCPPVTVGFPASSTDWFGVTVASASNNFSLYALSSPVTVAPEPAMLTLCGSALLGIASGVFVRRRRANGR